MYRSLLITLTLGLLIACDNGNLRAIPDQPSDTPDNQPLQPPTTLESSLFEIIKSMIIFFEEIEAEPLEKIIPDSELSFYQLYQDTNKARRRYLKEIYNKTTALLQEKMTPDDYLFGLLEMRMQSLNSRQQMIMSYLTGNGEHLPQPTSKKLFDFINEGQSSQALKYNKRLRTHVISFHEFLTLMIKETLLLYSTAAFSEATKHLLCSSIQLHPFLTDNRKDIPHPDECIVPYFTLGTILEPTIESTLSSHEKNKIKKLKQTLLKTCTKKAYPPGTPKIHQHIDLLLELQGKINSTTDPIIQETLLWLIRDRDIVAFYTHTPKSTIIQNEITGLEEEIILPSDYEAAQWPYPLPSFDSIMRNLPTKPFPLETTKGVYLIDYQTAPTNYTQPTPTNHPTTSTPINKQQKKRKKGPKKGPSRKATHKDSKKKRYTC